MNRYEFITELQRSLTGKVSVEKLQEITSYYNNYIDSELAKGKSEGEILKALGEPRLLAKSIVEAEAGRDAYGRSGKATNVEYDNAGQKKEWDSSGNLNRILFWFVLILVLCLVFSVIFGIIGLFFQYVFPILIPVLIVCWFIKHLKK